MGEKKQRELWNIQELIAYLKMPRATVYMYVANQTIPSVKIGRHRRFLPDEVEKALRKMGA